MKKYLFILCCLTFNVQAAEQNTRALPQPLTLEAALEFIDKEHPDLKYAESQVKLAESMLTESQSANDLTANLKAEARFVEPSAVSLNQQNDDHRIGLFVNKTLYDFGRTSALTESAQQQVLGKNMLYMNAYQQQYLAVMKAYFEVVLADLQYYRYNEEMAIAFIQYDRIQQRFKLGQHTELEVAEKEVEYYRIRRLRTYSQNQQRVTRAILAQALNRPDDLPETVTPPEINELKRKLPEVEELQKQVLEKNPVLNGLRASLEAARKNLEAARSTDNPVVSAGIEALAYSRELGSSDKLRAMLSIDVPLWSGGRVDAAIAKAKSEVYRAESAVLKQERVLQQHVLELWMNLQTQKQKYEEAEAGMNYSEMFLDNSRALYELEVKSDLGYSMVQFTAAEREVLKAGFEIAMSWAQIDALSGKLAGTKN